MCFLVCLPILYIKTKALFFIFLDKILKNNAFLWDFYVGSMSYEVTETFVVGPFDNSIRTQGEREELTLFTCAEKGTKRFVIKCAPASEEVAYEE